MDLKKKTGRRGENAAASYLIAHGYEILERNWRFSRAEIDIIGRKDGMLVFVEVKTRSSSLFGEPSSFVSPKKEKLMAEAASVYMDQIGHDWAIRFDIIGILERPSGKTELRHYQDAFFPGSH